MSTTITTNNSLNNKGENTMSNTLNGGNEEMKVNGGKDMETNCYVVMNNTKGVTAETKYSFESVSNLINAKKVLTKKENYRMQKIKLFKNEDGKTITEVDILTQGENDYIRGLAPTKATIALKGGKTETFDLKDKFISEYFVLEAHREFINSLRFDKVYLTKNHKLIWETTLGGEKVYINFSTNKKYKKLPKGAVEYRFFMYTSGTIKEQKSIWAKASINPIAEQNKHTCNMWDCYKEDISKEQAAKLSTRVGLSFSPNVKLKNKMTVGFYGGVFDKMSSNTEDDIVAKLEDIKNELDSYSNTSDGQAYGDAKVIQKMFNLKTEEEAIRLVFQARYLGIVKFQLIAIPHILFVEKVKEIREKEPYLLSVVGNNEIQVLCDKNCKKADFVSEGVDGLNLLLMSIGKLSTGKFSLQLIEKVLTAAAEEGRTLECRNQLKDLFINQMVEKITFIEEEKEVGINQDYIMDVLGCIDPTNPAVINRKYSDLMRTIANTIKKLSFACDSYNMVVAGDIATLFNIRIIKRGEALLGKFSKNNKNSKVGEKAVLIKYPSMGIRELLSVIVLSVEEACSRVVKAYEDGKINKNVMKGLIKYYKNMADATIMLPAISSFFKTLAGMDTDFDKIQVIFERVVVEYLYGRDELISLTKDGHDIVENLIKNRGKAENTKNVVSENNSIYNKIQERKRASKTTRRVKVSSNAQKAVKEILADKTQFNPNDTSFLHEMYVIASEFEGMIGVITYYNNKCVAMRTELINGNLVPAKRFMTELFGEEGDNEEYISEFEGEVNPMFAYNIVEKMRNCKWTANNMKAFLTDCIYVYRLYQETTIDAAKTGIYLTVLLKVDSVTPTSLLNVYYDDKTGEIVRALPKKKIITIKEYVDGEEVTRKVESYCFVDEIGRLQNALIEEANEAILKVKSENAKEFRYDDELVSELKSAISSLSLNNRNINLRNALYMLKTVYLDVTNKYVSLNNNEDEDSETAHLSFRTACSGLGNTVLRLLDKVTDNENTKSHILLGMSIMNKECTKVNPASTNRMAYNLLPGYTFAAVNGDNKYEGVSRLIQGGNDLLVGKELEFENGAALHLGRTILLADDYTGKATVRKDEFEIVDENDNVVGIEIEYRAYAEKEIKLEKVNKERFSLVIEKDKSFDITRNSVLYFDGDHIKMDYDITESEETSIICDTKNIALFDGSKKKEYFINAMSEVDIYDSVLGKKGYTQGATTKCLVLDLELVTEEIA